MIILRICFASSLQHQEKVSHDLQLLELSLKGTSDNGAESQGQGPSFTCIVVETQLIGSAEVSKDNSC